MEITEKRALITGGSSGIGMALAQALLDSGARVWIAGRSRERIDEAVATLRQFGNVEGIEADITDEDGRSAALNAVSSAGDLDILINCAGGVRAGALDMMAQDDILKMIDVNLTAPIMLTRAALPMLKRSAGMIVNVSSGYGLIGWPFYAVYAATKAGIAHFGESLRRELMGDGVRVLNVYPTATDTPMMSSSGASADDLESPEEVAGAIMKAIRDEALELVRGGPSRSEMVRRNRENPDTVDAMLLPKLESLEAAARNHNAL